MLELLQPPVLVCNCWLPWKFISGHIILCGHSCSSGELDGLGLYGTIAVFTAMCSLGIGGGCMNGGASIGSGRNGGGGGCGMDTFSVSVSATNAIGCNLGCELHLDVVCGSFGGSRRLMGDLDLLCTAKICGNGARALANFRSGSPGALVCGAWLAILFWCFGNAQ